MAFLTNRERLARDPHEFSGKHLDYMDWRSTQRHFDRLWKLALKWPATSRIPHGVFACVPPDEDTRKDVYSNCRDSVPRSAILESSDPAEDAAVLAMGLEDSDAVCRTVAASKFDFGGHAERAAALVKAGDDDILCGLAGNRTLRVKAGIKA